MDKRHGMLIVSVTILVLCFVGTASATNWSVDGRGKADFIGIQAAINNAKDGDTIIVSSDVYYENVVVYKSVTLMGIGQPVVDAGGKGDAIALCADGITLVGFTATNSGSLKEGATGIMVISCDNTIIGNNVSNNYWAGIRLDDSSSNNTITGNNVSNNNGNGISLASSSNNTITDNNVSNNNWDGISLASSSNNTITGNDVWGNRWGGIDLGYSSNNVITSNTFVNDGLSGCSYQNTVENNTVNGKPLVYLEDVSDHRVEDAGQVILVNCTNITVEDQDLSNTHVGIELWETEDSIISNNTLRNNDDGVKLWNSSNNTIKGNNVSNNNGDGISLASSSNNNSITGNDVRGNRWGGIDLGYSGNNVITSNTFVNDGLSGCSYQNTVENNTVNGKPLIYLEDVSDHRVEDAGQVILVNCNNITVEDLDLSNTHVGIELWETEDSIISNNTLCNNDDGVKLWNSSNNTIKGNNVSNNNGYGIFLYFSSSNNTIKGNNVSNNNYCGIHLHYSSNNIVTGNNVSSNNDVGIYLSSSSNNNSITGNNVRNNNWSGIHLWVSSNNTIYFNNFINNTNNMDSYKSTNIWNSPLEITYTYDGATYVSYLGNYWDDYEERYPDAEKIDSTGIWDTPYRIDEEEDNYPLMKPFENYNIIPTSAHT